MALELLDVWLKVAHTFRLLEWPECTSSTGLSPAITPHYLAYLMASSALLQKSHLSPCMAILLTMTKWFPFRLKNSTPVSEIWKASWNLEQNLSLKMGIWCGTFHKCYSTVTCNVLLNLPHSKKSQHCTARCFIQSDLPAQRVETFLMQGCPLSIKVNICNTVSKIKYKWLIPNLLYLI